LRKGLSDERGNLTLTFVEIANAIDDIRRGAGRQESIIVWENVPGVLSSKDNAFGCFLAGLCGEADALQPTGSKWTNAGCVYGQQRAVSWRVLDAQFFGVAQRRRRLFVVASARAGFDPAEVLFESEGLRRDIAPSREKGEKSAQSANESAEISISSPIAIAENTIGRQPHNGGNGDGFTVGGPMYTLNATGVHGVYCGTQNDALRDVGNNISPTLRSGNNGGAVTPCVYQPKGMVRRLTPKECERLQGFPDDHTLISWRGKLASDCPDGLRYKALGNSMAVPVMHWIGERIQKQI
jgi:DNA (cytosine-5)-methyltransferase 1